MRPAELLLRAILALTGPEHARAVILVIPREPRGWAGRRGAMRLFGRRGGPVAEILCCARPGQTTVRVDAKALADWLHSRGLASMRRDEDGSIYAVDDAGEITVELQVTGAGLADVVTDQGAS